MRQSGTEAGALAAIRFACTNLERVMVHTILTTSEQNRPTVMGCMMNKLKDWTVMVKECKVEGDKGPGNPQGPDCDPGWTPVNDYCIPPANGDNENS
jgi:hypothetical protein